MVDKKKLKQYCRVKVWDNNQPGREIYECKVCRKLFQIDLNSIAAMDFDVNKQRCKGFNKQSGVTAVIADSRGLDTVWEAPELVVRQVTPVNPITAIIEAAQKGMLHVDDWLDTPTFPSNKGEAYAKFVLEYKRMPAWKIMAFREWMEQFKLFCTYKDGIRYRVNGASRMGDVWLQKDFTIENGYDLRVDLKDCKDWGPTP